MLCLPIEAEMLQAGMCGKLHAVARSEAEIGWPASRPLQTFEC